MSDNRKYYYLKLKENFYNSETMVILESMQDGLLYSNLLLKMYLMSLKSGGILMLNDHLPHTPQTIATFTRHQVGTVERALKVFLEFGLVEILTDGAYYMADIQLLIGQSSTEGERKKKERMRLKRQKLLPSGGVDICPPYSQGDICPPEIRDKRLDIRDKSIENRESESRPRLWPLPECFPDGRGNGRLAGQLSHRMGPVHRKAVRVHGFYRQAVSEPCRHHPALGR